MRWTVLALGVLLCGGGLIWDFSRARSAAHALDLEGERLSGRIAAASAAARLRAEALGAMPVVRAAVETDAATLGDLARADFVFAPGADESLQVFQLGARAPLSLLKLPKDAREIAPARHSQVRLERDGEALRVVAQSLAEPLYKQRAVEGMIAVAHRVPSGLVVLDEDGDGVPVALPDELARQRVLLRSAPLAAQARPVEWGGFVLVIVGVVLARRQRPQLIAFETSFEDEPTPLPQLVPQALPSARSEEPPRVAERFLVLSPLSRGAASDVFLAKSGSKILALKQLRPSMLPEAAFNEAMQRASRVHHANVVELHEYGRSDDGYFVAMEYVEGVPLGALVDELARVHERLPLRCALAIGAALARGLEAVHGAHADDGTPLGLLHGALRPGKVLLGRRGTIKIADVGLSLVLPRSDGAAYLAPELEKDVRSDVYSVGAIVQELVPDPPRRLRRILQRALAPDPAARFPTCGPLACELEALLTLSGDTPVPTLGDWVERLRI